MKYMVVEHYDGRWNVCLYETKEEAQLAFNESKTSDTEIYLCEIKERWWDDSSLERERG